MRKFLNVGGGSKEIPVPPQYQGWQHVLLDIDPRSAPDVVCDARTLRTLPSGEYDAVYCSHNLEHYYRHDVPRVLAGFLHVLKLDGFLHLRVPDITAVIRASIEKNLDIGDVLYQSDAGPITVHDVIYGLGREIERSGNDFFAHKTGFTVKSLAGFLAAAGFKCVFIHSGAFEIQALAFRDRPSPHAAELFGVPMGPADGAR
jgi:hypothetical protein